MSRDCGFTLHERACQRPYGHASPHLIEVEQAEEWVPRWVTIEGLRLTKEYRTYRRRSAG